MACLLGGANFALVGDFVLHMHVHSFVVLLDCPVQIPYNVPPPSIYCPGRVVHNSDIKLRSTSNGD